MQALRQGRCGEEGGKIRSLPSRKGQHRAKTTTFTRCQRACCVDSRHSKSKELSMHKQTWGKRVGYAQASQRARSHGMTERIKGASM